MIFKIRVGQSVPGSGGKKETFPPPSVPKHFSLGSLVVTEAVVLGPRFGHPQWEGQRGIFTGNAPPREPDPFIQ